MNSQNNAGDVRRIGGLYAITPDEADTVALLDRTEQALAGGARLIQYRNKTADVALRLHQGELLLQLCRTHGVPLIVNDHLDLALAIDADGIHLGEHDASIAIARQRLGKQKIVGASCYNDPNLGRAAQAQGADYVAFGAFYPTATKRNTVVATLDTLHQAKAELTVPVVCIGGISVDNVLPLVQAGADAIAVSHALYRVAQVYETAAAFSGHFDH